MHFLKTGALCLLLLLCHAGAIAQRHTKDAAAKEPFLFGDLPPRMEWRRALFPQLLNLPLGERIRLALTDTFVLQGIVVSKSDPTDTHSQTVVIKCLNRPGAALAVTGVRNGAGGYRYSGRMLSLKHRDAYEIVEEGGRFALEKKETADLVME